MSGNSGKEDGLMRIAEKTEIDWRFPTAFERIFLASGIRRVNFRCTFRFILLTIIPAAAVALWLFFIELIIAEIFAGFYGACILVFFFVLESKCMRVFFGRIRVADGACYSRGHQFQYTVNGFSYYINVYRLSGSSDKRVFRLPAYRKTLMYANSGDNMLIVRFSKTDIRCFSKKELKLTSHSAKPGSRSKLSREEVLYVIRTERKKLREMKAMFAIDFIVAAGFNIYIMINYFSLFPYAVVLLLMMVFIDSLRVRRYSSRIKKLKTANVNALKNAVVSCFLLKKPKLTGGTDFVYYLKVMHPESGKFRICKLREYSWVHEFDNEISDNIIVIDYGKKGRGKDMQHYLMKEY